MPEDAAWCTWDLITHLVKTRFEICGCYCSHMTIINSFLLYCSCPSVPIVLKAETNVSIVYGLPLLLCSQLE